MVFRPAYFCFLAPGVDCWTSGPQIGPGISKLGPGWPGEVLGPTIGARKTWFCEGMVSKLEIMGFPATQMGCMIPRRPLGKLVSLQTLKQTCSYPPFLIWGKFGEGPPGPPVYPQWALCGPYRAYLRTHAQLMCAKHVVRHWLHSSELENPADANAI